MMKQPKKSNHGKLPLRGVSRLSSGSHASFRLIPLTQDRFAIVDADKYEWLNQWKWCALKSKNSYRAIRAIKKNGKWTTCYMSRFILNAPDNLQVDHKNHNILDNRESNLRLCDQTQNNANQLIKAGGKSQYKGVSWDKTRKRKKRWVGEIKCYGKKIRLGHFLTEIEAAKAYDAKAVELFGEFAYTNFSGSRTSAADYRRSK